MLKLALRNVFRQRLRTGLTLLAVATGVLGLILSGGFIEDVFVQLGEATIHSRLGHLQVTRAGYRTAGRTEPYTPDEAPRAMAVFGQEALDRLAESDSTVKTLFDEREATYRRLQAEWTLRQHGERPGW